MKKIEVFKADDGTEFNTESAAINHEANLILHHGLEEVLNKYYHDNVSEDHMETPVREIVEAITDNKVDISAQLSNYFKTVKPLK